MKTAIVSGNLGKNINCSTIILLPVRVIYRQKLYRDTASLLCIRKALFPEPAKRFKILSQEAERS